MGTINRPLRSSSTKGDASVTGKYFCGSTTNRGLNGNSTKGDASVPTTHPHRSRPYAIWDPSPRFVVDPLGRGCLTGYWTLTKDSPSYWSQMYYDGDPWGTGECGLHRFLIGKGLGQTP